MALGANDFSIHWGDEKFYVFPPVGLLNRVTEKVKLDKV